MSIVLASTVLTGCGEDEERRPDGREPSAATEPDAFDTIGPYSPRRPDDEDIDDAQRDETVNARTPDDLGRACFARRVTRRNVTALPRERHVAGVPQDVRQALRVAFRGREQEFGDVVTDVIRPGDPAPLLAPAVHVYRLSSAPRAAKTAAVLARSGRPILQRGRLVVVVAARASIPGNPHPPMVPTDATRELIDHCIGETQDRTE